MEDFINLVDKLEPNAKCAASDTIEYVRKKPLHATSSNQMQGKLYKLRDVMGGWRERYFILQGNFLYYYLQQDDPNPRGTLNISMCTISTETQETVGDEDYYPFVITVDGTDQVYRLAADNKLDADIWISKIIEASTLSQTSDEVTPPYTPNTSSQTAELLPSSSSSSSAEMCMSTTTWPDFYMKNVQCPDETRSNLPREKLDKIETVVKQVCDELQPDAPNWGVLWEKGDYRVYRKVGTSILHVKIECHFPCNILHCINLGLNAGRQTELDPGKQIHTVLKSFSNHSWIEYVQYGAVSRPFCFY
jgi:hypothetical protein